MNQPIPPLQPESWCKLHLVPQTEGNTTMPPYIVGVLMQETPTSLVLKKVVQEVETDDGWEDQPTEGISFINRTYVWRCEMLPFKPIFGRETEIYNGEGGLG